MHRCGRMALNARIPTLPGRSTSSFVPPSRYWLHQSQSAVKDWASRIEGELHPAKSNFEVVIVAYGWPHRMP